MFLYLNFVILASNSGTKWYIIVAVVVSVIFIGVLCYIICCFRHRCRKSKKPKRKLESRANEVDLTYQELDLTKMDREDNYQSLVHKNTRGQSNFEKPATEDDTTYQQLDLSNMNTEDNYQSLTNRKLQSGKKPDTTEVDTTYQELDVTKMNTEDDYQSLNACSSTEDSQNDDDSGYINVTSRGPENFVKDNNRLS